MLQTLEWYFLTVHVISLKLINVLFLKQIPKMYVQIQYGCHVGVKLP